MFCVRSKCFLVFEIFFEWFYIDKINIDKIRSEVVVLDRMNYKYRLWFFFIFKNMNFYYKEFYVFKVNLILRF